jgi:hypothetical protein
LQTLLFKNSEDFKEEEEKPLIEKMCRRRPSKLVEQLSRTKTKESKKATSKSSERMSRFIFVVMVLPTLFSLWYAAAILFPPEARTGGWRYLLWTDGAKTTNEEGQVTICPRASICSKGVFQVVLFNLARLTGK